MVYRVKVSDGSRVELLEWIQAQKKGRQFTVIDIGGSASGWSSSVLDALCDCNPPVQAVDSIKFFKIDICNPEDWKLVEDYVQDHGKFDFSICTHTLEDIRNPDLVCKKLSQISKAGYIAVPSKYRELSRFEDSQFPYRGYIHHRWIFSVSRNRFVGYPKLPYLEHDSKFNRVMDMSATKADLSFHWDTTLSLSLMNQDYLGPSGEAVRGYYDQLLSDDLDQIPLWNQRYQDLYSSAGIPKSHYTYLIHLKQQGFEPTVAYDIGACVTEWTRTVKLVWPNCKVFCFEAFDRLEPILKQSGETYFITILSDSDTKTVKFYQNNMMITGNSYYQEVGCSIQYYPDDMYVERKTDRLDTLVKRYSLPTPDLVKIDVQGSEHDVLEGGWNTIQHATHMIVEMQQIEYNKNAPKVTETLPWIESHGWKCIAPLFTNNSGIDGDYGFKRDSES